MQFGQSSHTRYLHGKPVRPIVPLDVGLKGIFIVGAYTLERLELRLPKEIAPAAPMGL